MFLHFLYSHLTDKRTILLILYVFQTENARDSLACVSARQERKIREKNIPLKGRKEIYPVLPNKAFDCTLRAALG